MSAFAKTVKTFKQVIFAIIAVTLTACGGGGGGGSKTTSPTSVSFSGNAVDGPVIFADVSLYGLTYGASVSVDSTAIDTATTDASAKIQGLSIPLPLPSAPYAYVLEFTENVGTTLDLSTCSDPSNPTTATCSAPVISTMRTVLTDEMVSGGKNIYATPLTTMAVNIALTKAKGGSSYDNNPNDGVIDAAEFKAAVEDAALTVTSTLGFGMDSSVNIFDTPPLIDETVNSPEEQQAVADYRTAVAAVSAIINQMDQQASGDADTVMTELAADLSDGLIDGQVDPDGDGVSEPSQVFSDTTIQVLDQDPATLVIPGTTTTVAEIESQLEAESQATSGTAVTLDPSVSTEPEPAETNPDKDGDGVLNADDAFPDDGTRKYDTDKDGIANIDDTDDDGDNIADGSDAFPLNKNESADTDGDCGTITTQTTTSGDGCGDNSDTDIDGDGTLNGSDDFPFDPAKQNKNDVDNDGWDVDADPNDSDNTNPGIPFVDTDGDGLADNGGNAPDGDDDNDGVVDGSDAFPLNKNESSDTDGDCGVIATQTTTSGDGCGDNSDTDIDGDGVANAQDAFPFDSTETKDTDKDGIGNNTDTDDDGDGIADATEDAAAADPDGDGKPNREDIDSDGDGYLDGVDLDPYDPSVTINFAPVADDVSVTIDEDVQASGNLVATDANVGDTLTYSLVASSEVNGTANITAATGAFTFDPTAEFSGTASFQYRVSDGSANSNVGTVTITVNAVNDAPVIAQTGPLAVTMDEDSAPTDFVAPTISATDVEGETLTWSLGSAASNGTATVSGTGANPTVDYVPNANFNGSDSFTVEVSDGVNTPVSITVDVTVNSLDDSPVIAQTGPLAVAMDEDSSPTAFAAPTVSATDVDSATLTWSVSSAATNGTATVSGVGASPTTFTYVPDADFSGSDSFTIQVTDGVSAPATIVIDVTVNAVNDSPVIAQTGPLAVTMDEDSAPTDFVAPTITATDVEGETLTWSVSSAASNGTATVSGTGASPTTLDYVPSANFSGSDSFTVQVTDGVSTPATIVVNVTVDPVNDSPVIAQTGPLAVTMDEDGSPTAFVAPTVSATDVEGETLTWSVSSAASNGTATVSGTGASPTTFTYVPNADFNGSDSFTVQVTDGVSTPATIVIDVTVDAVNDAPVIAQTGPLAVSMSEDSAPTDFVAPTVSATDAEGETLTWSLGSAASNGTATVSGTGASPTTLDYVPSANFNGSDSFTVEVSDGVNTPVSITVDVTVNAENDAPVAVNDSASVQPSNFIDIDVLANDTDVDIGDTKSVISVTAVGGTATGSSVSNNGTNVTFTAGAVEGTATFDYTMQDAAGAQSTATVTVNVVANASPVISQGASVNVTMDEDGVPTAFVAPTIDATDADSDPLTWELDTQATYGTANVSGTGASPTITYAPDINYNGSDSFVVRVTDGISTPATITVNVTLNPVNDNPVANDDSATTTVGETITIDVLANDNDTIDGDTISVDSVGTATGGSATNNTTDVSYTAPGTAGSYSFTYTISDGNGGFASATVNVTVNDAPIEASGVWQVDNTVTVATELNGAGSCDVAVNDTDTTVVSISQSGTAISLVTTDGVNLSGTIDESTGAFSMSGTAVDTGPDIDQPTNGTATETWTDTITLTGTVAANGTMTGTLNIVENWNGTNECDVTQSVSGNFIYKHTGGETYSGVYAVELAGNEEENDGSTVQGRDWREGLPVELRFTDGGTPEVEFGIPEEGDIMTVNSATFDPSNGFFSIELDVRKFEDWNGDLTIDWSRNETLTLSGILLDPAGNTDGAPLVALSLREHGRGYNGDFTAGGTAASVTHNWADGYGKKLTTMGHTRTSTLELNNGNTVTRIYAGLLNAPLINGNGNDLWLRVRDAGDTTDLCTVRYYSTDTEAGRYFEQTNMPHPDMATLSFRGNVYSSLNCDASNGGANTINLNDPVILRIVDDGGDGIDGANADTEVYSTTYNLLPVVNGIDRFSVAQNPNDMNINGAKASSTQLGTVQVPGYFNYGNDIPVTFPAHLEGADVYQVRVERPGDFIQYRYNLNNPAGGMITIPAGTLEETQQLRLVAIKDDTNGARAMSFSRRAQIKQGIYGHFNFELGQDVDGEIQTFSMFLDSDTGGNVFGAVTNTDAVTFVSGSYNLGNDTVSLTLTDVNNNLGNGAGAQFTIELDFATTGKSNVAIVTSPNATMTNARARAVAPEVMVRSYRMSNGNQRSVVTLANVPDPSTWTSGTFKRFDDADFVFGGLTQIGVAGRKLWDDSTYVDGTCGAGEITFDCKASKFQAWPIGDGKAQFNGYFVSSNTDGWGFGADGLLAATDYKVVLQDASLNKLIFKTTYAAPDPSSYVSPQLSNMTIVLPNGTDQVCANGGNCSSTQPVDISSDNDPTGVVPPTWGLKWAGTLPAGAYWRIVAREVNTGIQIRTDFLQEGDPGLTNNFDGTWTWVDADGFHGLDTGMVVSLEVRVSNAYGWPADVYGANVNGHRAYVTQPASLACGYESGWDDLAYGGLGAPINPNSFADFEAVIADCGTAMTFTAADVVGIYSESPELVTYDALTGGQLGTEANPGTGTFDDDGTGTTLIDFIWWVETSVAGHNYVVIYTDDTIDTSGAIPPGVSMRETSAVMGISGSDYSFYHYSEQSNYGDMVRDSGSDGEIWTSIKIKQ